MLESVKPRGAMQAYFWDADMESIIRCFLLGFFLQTWQSCRNPFGFAQDTWKTITGSKWLMAMICQSPKMGCSPYKRHKNCLYMQTIGVTNHLLTEMIPQAGIGDAGIARRSFCLYR